MISIDRNIRIAVENEEYAISEDTLDPKDWSSFKALAHRMVDDMVDHLSNLDSRPAWQEMPAHTRCAIDEPLPMMAQGADRAYNDFVEHVLPYPNGNLHPRYWGWVQGTGTPLAMMAEMLASGLNPHMAGFNQAPVLVEKQVVEWLRQMMGMPDGASGLLVSGGMMANILGLTIARHDKAGFDINECGTQQSERLLTVYGSMETHGWLKKGCQFLGLGNRAVRAVPANASFQMDVEALRKMIEADLSKGHTPICLVGNAGTVNSGAVDDFPALFDVCQQYDLWFHIDGAFGAFAKLSQQTAHLVEGLEKADSVGLDLHKWLYMPFEAACVLVRDERAHIDTFRMKADYIEEYPRGTIAGGLPFADRGLELTRNFKALKVWMSIKAHGVETFSRLVDQNISQARYLASRVSNEAQLELLAPVSLNVVCFRFKKTGIPEKKLDELNKELLMQLQESGEAVASGTRINENFALRVAIVNHRSRLKDFDRLVNAVVSIGNSLA